MVVKATSISRDDMQPSVSEYKKLSDCMKDLDTHVATGTRWVRKGALDGLGERQFLQAVRSPGGWLTCDLWVREFLEALARGRTEADQATARTPTQRRKAAERAARELDDKGM